MNGKKKVTMGAIITLAAFVQFIAVGFLTTSKPELSFLSSISAGILGGDLSVGIGQIRRGSDPKIDKQKRIEEQDERNLMIRGKAAYIAFWVAATLILIFGEYVLYILENRTAALICYGITAAALITYGIAYKVIGRKV